MQFYSYSQSTPLAPYEGWRIWIGLMTEFINLSKQTHTNNFLVSDIIISQQHITAINFNLIQFYIYRTHAALHTSNPTNYLSTPELFGKGNFQLKVLTSFVRHDALALPSINTCSTAGQQTQTHLFLCPV